MLRKSLNYKYLQFNSWSRETLFIISKLVILLNAAAKNRLIKFVNNEMIITNFLAIALVVMIAYDRNYVILSKN